MNQQKKIDAVRELADRALSRFFGISTWVNRPPHIGEDCISTAICKESGNDHLVALDLYWVIHDRVGGRDPTKWNDDPERTFDDVVDLLVSIIEDDNLKIPDPMVMHGK
jgi:hypothetical protein